MIIREFDIEICKDNVMRLIDCYRQSDIYEEVMEEYEEILPGVYERIEPTALLEFGSISEFAPKEEKDLTGEALYCITSVGGRVSQWTTELFARGDYLGQMLADAMADDYLFQMDHLLSDTVIKLCRERKCGVRRRLEAPQDIPMQVQKWALEVADKERLTGIHVNESYMYEPVKTICQIYLLDRHPERFAIGHDCSRCPNGTCRLRHIPEFTVKIVGAGDAPEKASVDIKGKKGTTLMEVLKENGIFLSAVCAGRGTCGKCRIRVLEGEVPSGPEDERFFGVEGIARGYRLACRAYAEGDCTITLDCGQEEGFAIVTDYAGEGVAPIPADMEGQGTSEYGIAADIGTTTIAMQLIDLKSARVVRTYTAMNRQRAYGADVISRMEASNKGKGKELKESIREDLAAGIESLTGKGRGRASVGRMVIGANTTMVHLLMGYSCETLGVFPFTPVNLDTIHTTARKLLGSAESCGGGGAEACGQDFEVEIYPGISTYVGGDITAGLFALGFHKREKAAVLIDLGTNGEMAIGCRDKIYVASTAAGPAFEGGNITCGTGSIPGAICKVAITDGRAHLETIQNRPVSGICGTGVVEITYELLKEGLIDDTGLLKEEYFQEGYPLGRDPSGHPITFSQKDVREIQLAKSAVRAGLETLILRYGISYSQIETVYIAGGFGYQLDLHKSVGIGLLPKECESRLEAVGNSCLKGAMAKLLRLDGEQAISAIRKVSEEIRLSNDKDFNELYMDYMFFEEV